MSSSAFVEYTVNGELYTQEFEFGPGYLELASQYARNLDSWDRIYHVVDGEEVILSLPQTTPETNTDSTQQDIYNSSNI